MSFAPDPKLIARFVEWIEEFDSIYARKWAQRYLADNEAAAAEAATWGLLVDCGASVEPYDISEDGSKAPDFRCTKNGYVFYVEATCIRIDTAVDKTRLPHPPERGFRSYSNLNRSIFYECQNKVGQCASVPAPCLVSVVTFHAGASAICVEKQHLEMLLTGQQLLAWDVDVETGQAVGENYVLTHLRTSAFIKPGTESVGEARQPISGVLVAGLGIVPPHVYGLLHPKPNHPFDPRLLDRIEFGRLIGDYRSGDLSVTWDPPA